MDDDPLLTLTDAFIREHTRTMQLEEAAHRLGERVRVLTTERDELVARLAVVEAERDMLREDDVDARSDGDGPRLTDSDV